MGQEFLDHIAERRRWPCAGINMQIRNKKAIHIMIGGDDHTFLDQPVIFINKTGSDVLVNRLGWACIILDRLDFEFTGYKNTELAKSHPVVDREKTNE